MSGRAETAGFVEGPFKEGFETLIAVKRGRGEKVVPSAIFAMKRANAGLAATGEASLTRRAVESALAPREDESPDLRWRKACAIRQLSELLRALGEDAWPVPDRYVPPAPQRFRPYPLSEAEMDGVVAAADSVYGSMPGRHCSIVWPCVARVLVGTGMRIGEVLALGVGDVDMEAGVITVAKFKGASRLVPVSGSLLDHLRAYGERAEAASPARSAFFECARTGANYTYNAAWPAFRRIYAAAGVLTDAGEPPRIHDIRHGFVTNALDRLVSGGMDLYAAVPLVAAYVGHTKLVDTEKYVHLTRHAHEGLIARESELEALLPEVAYHGR